MTTKIPLTDYIAEIYDTYSDQLSAGTWASENDRWKELVICLLHQLHPEKDMVSLRSAIDMLEDLGLLTPTTLMNLDKNQVVVLEHVFSKCNFNKNQISASIQLLSQVSNGIGAEHDYMLQRLMRDQFKIMLDFLHAHFPIIILSSAKFKTALIHWFQNTMNAPISIADEPVDKFCKEHNITTKDLFEAADQLGINYAILDDLILLKNSDKT